MSRARVGCAAVLSLGVALSLPVQACAAEPGRFVSVDGRRFVDQDGQTLQLKGINLGNWLMPEGYMFKFVHAKSPDKIRSAFTAILGEPQADAFWRAFRQRFITRDDIRLLHRMGFNTIRVPIHYDLFMRGEEPPTFVGEGWDLLDRLIGWCREEGLLVVIDLHGAPGGQTGINHDGGPGYPILFYVPQYQRLTVALWREIARRYRDQTAVLAYDVLNEPIAPYHDVSLLQPRLQQLYRKLVAAIREEDPNHIVTLEGTHWGTSFAALDPPFDSKLAFSYHKFWSYTTRAAIAEYLNFSYRYDVPVWLGESGELTDEWTHDFRSLHERYGIGWSFWTYKNMDTDSSVVSIRRPAGWDAVVRIADDSATDLVVAAKAWARTTEPTETAAARGALAAYLDNIELQNCVVNRGYVEALGLQVPADAGLAGAVPPTHARD